MESIVIKDLYKNYTIGEMQVPVLRGVTLSIARGEFVALTGASGSGKTTLMNIIGCLDQPTSGEYFLEGRLVSSLSSDERASVRNNRIGFVFQSFNLLRRTSALDNVLLPTQYSMDQMLIEKASERAVEILTRVGLSSRLYHEPSQLSGGQQQRVAIARALINRPAILLADEPTGNLDSQSSYEVLEMFREINERDGITVIIVTHEPDVAARAKRVIKLHDGIVVDEAPQHGAST